MAFQEFEQMMILQQLEFVELEADNHPRRFYQAQNVFEELSDKQFIKKFRLSKELAGELIEVLTPYMSEQTRKTSISIERKVLTALRFFTSGSYQLDIGDNRSSGLSQASVSRCITEVTDAMNMSDVVKRYVHFPDSFEKLNTIRRGFYEKTGVPGVIGCIDCTHIAIFPPRSEGLYAEHIYVNRKGYHSINTQLVCDSDTRILNVNANYPGSTHDSYIWRQSCVSTYMENLHSNGHSSYFLLGDSGYPLRSWLLTPLSDPTPDSPDARYNNWLTSTRSTIERCNGILKMRFRCLLKHRVLHYHPERASKIIIACTILHNMCINDNIPVPINEPDDPVNIDFGMYDAQIIPDPVVGQQLTIGRRMQQLVIRSYFTRR
ncbi:putative nuclease HARBI1 [Acyrthosiphon pisum]|uniref:DDE Tnp4 domain-containing protein n=1 Tax=Acyrthosiphon pisum TaxID=7029 RepID=A0A8R2B3D7_ACYPI|nr:putative nuclease HARBI1 [Acyrthosiphon pisum]XP_029341860.1 putative nuclease HARBI1 [Acyrthosiphon pisum]|eukprot:XP_008178491.1 PREDICTED: putative nuclease HARBI1 [Acyrthosiphon pisum]